jgi:hypothetical protein
MYVYVYLCMYVCMYVCMKSFAIAISKNIHGYEDMTAMAYA